jgi:hypothetical protein
MSFTRLIDDFMFSVTSSLGCPMIAYQPRRFATLEFVVYTVGHQL